MASIVERIEKIFIFFLIYSIVFYLFFSTLSYTLPFVLAIVFALMLKRPTGIMINKYKVKPWIASLTSTFIFFVILITLITLSTTSIISETISFTKFIPNYISTTSAELYEYFIELNNNLSLQIDANILESIKSSLTQSISDIMKSTLNLSSLLIQKTIEVLSYIPYIVMVIIFTLISTYFFTKSLSSSSGKSISAFAPNNSKKIIEVASQAKKMIGNYVISYMAIIFITFIVTFIGFIILKVDYALILSLLCALFDLLPVIGMPVIYFPLAIFYFAQGSYFTAIGLIILYAVVFILRQVIEPKIMSTSLGLNPVAVLAAIFIGLKANGVTGMLFCMFLVVFYNVLVKVKVL
ncbi:sporulation integral membrane protein YtvI [Clostridium polynesiense]|uniref:sporulation integral membrane protein YtvI n=1 Tax=Clostridium polynesiense TaxID=1325933 RepID=UPI00058E4F1A|nr:sporulation integral membrane protein YtvI [Clostridium polynesiense]